MSYEITLTSGNILCSVPDGQLVTSFGGLTLMGHKYPSIGTVLNTDLVHIIENFASSTPPVNPLLGQLWYDSVSNNINFWNGTEFNSISVITSADTAPLTPEEGDEWFNTSTDQLYIWSGTQWILIGPPGSSNGGTEGFVVKSISVNGNQIYYLELYANNELLGIISAEDIMQPGIAGFGNIRAGLNFVVSPTLGLASGGIFNINELTIGTSDQIDISVDSQNNMVIAINEDTNGGNVLIADTNGTIPPEMSTLMGTIYVNNLVAIGSISGSVPGNDGDILFNNHGVTGSSTNLTVSSDRSNVSITNTLFTNNIIANNITSNNQVITGNLNVDGDDFVTGQLLVSGQASFNYGSSGEFSLPASQGLNGNVLLSNGNGTTSWSNITTAGWSSGQVGTSWWTKNPIGQIHQWGYYTGSNPVTINFPTSFSVGFIPTVVVGSNHLNAESPATAASITNTGFEFVVSGGSNDAMAWTADGY
jgi:hypothetical protein